MALISFEERKVRVQAVDDYQKFMALKAPATTLIAIIEDERMTPRVSWRGSNKSDLPVPLPPGTMVFRMSISRSFATD